MLQIRNIFFSLVFLFSFFNSSAQIWCRPGATWHFTHYSPSASLYTRLNYIKDTLILSKNCNRISYYTQGFGMFGPVSYYGQNIHTHISGNVVYILDVTGTTNDFDTLFNYGANIGDSWYMAPKSMTNCANSKITVADTGHVFIQSQYLKWLKVNVNGYSYSGPTFFTDTIFERIGCVLKYFYYPQDICPNIVDSEKGGPLRCYDDNQIIGYKRIGSVCNYYYSMDIDEKTHLNNSSVYPNPTKDRLYISSDFLKSGDEIVIKSVLGQVMQRNILKSDEGINISEFQNGVYFLQIFRNNKLISTKKIIKQ